MYFSKKEEAYGLDNMKWNAPHVCVPAEIAWFGRMIFQRERSFYALCSGVRQPGYTYVYQSRQNYGHIKLRKQRNWCAET